MPKICIFKDSDKCKKGASFNYEGQRPIYCFKHKLDGMIGVKFKKCSFESCKKRSYYKFKKNSDLIGDDPRYCRIHKQKNMIHGHHESCIFDNCYKIAYYRHEFEEKPVFCVLHKQHNMINTITKVCSFENCKTYASFNFRGKKNPVFCSIHKSPDMINVIKKNCIYESCNKLAYFNIEGESAPLYCRKHKNETMVLVNGRLCKNTNCNKNASYNFKDKKTRMYCFLHKLDGMIDIINKYCKSYNCCTRVTKKYKGYCMRCFIDIFPDEKVSRNYKTKEFSVVQYVKNKFPNLDWRADKRIHDGFSKKRPDLLVDLGHKVLIIEIDENQHNNSNYDLSCENIRIMEISKDLNNRPIVFIRFNPDGYESEKGGKILSCWGFNSNRICCVKEKKKKEWDERLRRLEDEISKTIKEEGKEELKMIEVINLFFNV